MLTASLITLGSPDQLTGGYLYHRRMADLAPAHDARVDFVSVPAVSFLPAVAAGRRVARTAKGADVMVVDSIAAACLAPWRLPRPAVGILHQPPGGIDGGPARRAVQRWLDGAMYGRCEVLILASQTLVNGPPPPYDVPAIQPTQRPQLNDGCFAFERTWSQFTRFRRGTSVR